MDFHSGSDGKESACDSEDPGSIPGSGRSPGVGNGNLLHYSCLENSMDRGAWWATVRWVTKSRTRLKQLSTHPLFFFFSVVFEKSHSCSERLNFMYNLYSLVLVNGRDQGEGKSSFSKLHITWITPRVVRPAKVLQYEPLSQAAKPPE